MMSTESDKLTGAALAGVAVLQKQQVELSPPNWMQPTGRSLGAAGPHVQLDDAIPSEERILLSYADVLAAFLEVNPSLEAMTKDEVRAVLQRLQHEVDRRF